MNEAMYWANESFLIEDPDFAVDFAPNGMMMNSRDEPLLMFAGTLLGFNEIMTRKRYGE
jgi:hypothetical protein